MSEIQLFDPVDVLRRERDEWKAKAERAERGGACEDHLLKHGAEAEALRRGLEALLAWWEKPYAKRRRADLTTRLRALLDRVDAGESLAWLEEREELRHEDQDDTERNPLEDRPPPARLTSERLAEIRRLVHPRPGVTESPGAFAALDLLVEVAPLRRAKTRTGVYPRVMSAPVGEDGLTEAETAELGSVLTWAGELAHREGGAVAERFLIAEICSAREDQRPAAFIAALERERLAIQLDDGAAEEPDG